MSVGGTVKIKMYMDQPTCPGDVMACSWWEKKLVLVIVIKRVLDFRYWKTINK